MIPPRDRNDRAHHDTSLGVAKGQSPNYICWKVTNLTIKLSGADWRGYARLCARRIKMRERDQQIDLKLHYKNT